MSDLVTPPRTLCILRLSAIGDVTHVVAIVRTLQHAWPDTAITWVIGRIEARLIGLLPGVELIIIDKRSLRAGALRAPSASCAAGASTCCCTCRPRCAPACTRR